MINDIQHQLANGVGGNKFRKVFFYSADGGSEGMWVEVVDEDSRTGILDNNPVVVFNEVQLGDTVSFRYDEEYDAFYWNGPESVNEEVDVR